MNDTVPAREHSSVEYRLAMTGLGSILVVSIAFGIYFVCERHWWGFIFILPGIIYDIALIGQSRDAGKRKEADLTAQIAE